MGDVTSFQAKAISGRPDLASFSDLCKQAGFESDIQLDRRFLDIKSLSVLLNQKGELISAASLFLVECELRGRGATNSTARTYAESLLNWLRFLQKRNVLLTEAKEEDLQLYRVNLAKGSKPNSDERYATATVNLRVSAVAMFYEWGWRTRLLLSPLGEYLSSQEKKGRPMLCVIKRIPQVLTLSEVAGIFSSAKQPYRLMFQWGLCAGVRRFEVCSLPLSQLPSIDQIATQEGGLFAVRILRKCGKDQKITAPIQLIERTHWYCLTERPVPATPEASNYVFLNQRGRPIKFSCLSAEFRRCADSIGAKDVVLHHLRHTFATNVLTVLQGSDDPMVVHNAAKILQVLLGHSHLETTEIYIHSTQTQSPVVFDALSYLYGACE